MRCPQCQKPTVNAFPGASTKCSCGHTYVVAHLPEANPHPPSVNPKVTSARASNPVAASASASARRMCPRCHVALDDHEGLETCDHCAGLFVSAAALKTYAASARAGVPPNLKLQARAKVDCSSYVKCPICSNWMHRANFSRVSGVVVDTCAAHGTWFDGDELSRALKFLAEHPEAEQKAEAASAQESARDIERRKEFAQAVGRETFDEANQGYARARHNAEYDQRMNDSVIEDVLRIFLKIF
jgi:Zn-finger nucleic acid-binding protein